MIKLTNQLLILVLATALLGCTGMKNISSNDPLYVGHLIKFKDKKPEDNKLTLQLKGLLKPEPNNTLLWMIRFGKGEEVLEKKDRGPCFTFARQTRSGFRCTAEQSFS
jgi:hypothetical protein